MLKQVGAFGGPSECAWSSVPPWPLQRLPTTGPELLCSVGRKWPPKEGLDCCNQSARPLCLHGIIPLDLRRVELFKQMAQIIRVAGVSVHCSVSSMLPDMTHVTSSSQHDAGGMTLSVVLGFHGLTC